MRYIGMKADKNLWQGVREEGIFQKNLKTKILKWKKTLMRKANLNSTKVCLMKSGISRT